MTEIPQHYELTLRDRLALDRTYLAKERTILAYVRTGLAFLGVAFFVYRFMDAEAGMKALMTLVFAVPGVYAVAYGMYKTIVRRRERKEFERKFGMVNGNGK